MDFFSTTKTLGILGGGQLGKMLLYTTRKWDVKTKVLDPSENAPAQLACDEFVVGDLTDFQAVYDFGKGVDILTIEIEKVNVEALEQLEKEGVKVYPTPCFKNHSKQMLPKTILQKTPHSYCFVRGVRNLGPSQGCRDKRSSVFSICVEIRRNGL